MSPEQLIQLQKLSRLFEQGIAGPDQIKQLSELLALINSHEEDSDFFIGKPEPLFDLK